MTLYSADPCRTWSWSGLQRERQQQLVREYGINYEIRNEDIICLHLLWGRKQGILQGGMGGGGPAFPGESTLDSGARLRHKAHMPGYGRKSGAKPEDAKGLHAPNS